MKKIKNEMLDRRTVPHKTEGSRDLGSLDVMGRLVYEMVDGRADVAAIADACGIDTDLALRILSDLADRGWVSGPWLGEPAAADPGGSGESDLERDVERLHDKIASANFYELLGVAPDASRAEIRRAYFELSKRFHPDKAFGKNAAALGRKMEIVFRHMTVAYDTLSTTQARHDYDVSIADQVELWRIEQQLTAAMKRTAPAAERTPAATSAAPRRSEDPAVRPPTPSAPSLPAAPRPSGPAGSGPAPAPSAAPEARRSSDPAKPRPDLEARRRQWRQERAHRAITSILGRGSNPPPKPAPKQAGARLKDAVAAFEQARFTDAERALAEVLMADPVNAQAKQMMDMIGTERARRIAKEHLRQAKYEQLNGHLDEAEKQLEFALKMDRDNMDARHLLSEVLLRGGKDLGRALKLASEVVTAGGQRARYFATLGELRLLAKDNQKAYDALERAVALEPDNKEYRRLLKLCKK